jgi:hypothetical protein
MKKTLIVVAILIATATIAHADDARLNAGSQNQIYNNQPLTGGSGERTVVAVEEFVNAIIQIAKGPTPIYQVPAIIVPREYSKNEQDAMAGLQTQPFCGYFGANYIADYKDATNGILVVKGNIQIILPNDGYTRTVEQKGNKIIIHNVNLNKDLVVGIM